MPMKLKQKPKIRKRRRRSNQQNRKLPMNKLISSLHPLSPAAANGLPNDLDLPMGGRESEGVDVFKRSDTRFCKRSLTFP